MMKLRTTAFLLFSGLYFLGSTAFAQYKLKESRSPIINNYLKASVGKTLDLSQIDHLVQDISQSGLFQMVYAEVNDKNQVSINAQESSKLESIVFEGNDFFTDEYFREELGLQNLKSMSSLQIKQTLQKMKDLYSNAGFFDTTIQFATTKVKDGTRLTYKVSEGRSCIIEDISFYSNNPILNKKSIDLLADFQNKPFRQNTQSEIQKTIEDYFADQRYLVAEVSSIQTQFNPQKTKVKINVSIKDPTLFEFIFHGNHFFTHFDLIKKSKIGGKFLYLSNSSSELADNIRDYYRSYGFPKATVKYEERNFPKLNKKIIVVKIKEGQRVRIEKINVFGKISKPRSFYIEKIEEFLSNESKNIYFVQSAVQRAVDKMIIQLKNKGFLLAEAISTNLEMTPQGNAKVNIQIDEGMLTYIRQVLFRGSKAFSNLTLRKQIHLQSNTALDLKDIEDSFATLERFYKEQGFLEYEQKNRNASVIKYNYGQPFADIVYEIQEGPRIIVKDIQIKGNLKTKDYVIRRELAFKKGDTLNLSKVTRSIDLLEKTGLFSDVQIETVEKGTNEDQRTVLVQVRERFPGLFSTGVGINNELDLTFRGYLGVVYSNLGGKARAVSSRLDLNYSTQVPIYYLENRLAVGYYEPYLFKDRVRGRASIVRDEKVFSLEDRVVGTKTDRVATILSKNELNLNAEKELSSHLRLSYRFWGFSNQTTFDRSPNKDNLKTINIGTTGPKIEFDYRNDKFLPTSGAYTSWDLEYSDPILGSSRASGTSKEINYYKTTLGTSFYIPLTKSHRYVWANAVRGGYLKNISRKSSSGVPAVKSFFLGGSSTIRGFQNATERIPNVNELCASQAPCELADFFVPKDSYYYLVKSEFRFPIFNSVGGVLFYDGGAVHIKGISLSDPYRESVGFGLRFETPVGAFVIEVGFKLDRKVDNPLYTDENPFVLHFNLGSF